MSENVTGSPSAESTAPTPSAAPATATPVAPASPATPAPQAPATSGVPDGYVPSYRLRETREAAQREYATQWQTKENEYKSELARVQQQLRSLVGVNAPPDPETSAVRNQFGQLYPGLTKLEERSQDLLSLIERAQDLSSQNEHYWSSYGRQTMDRLYDQAEKALGAPLTEDGKRHLHSSFSGFVQSSPELSQRYAQDPSIVDDFVKALTSNFIDPARRAAGANVATRASVSIPQDTPGGAPRATPAPQPSGLDERAAQAWALYQAGKQQ